MVEKKKTAVKKPAKKASAKASVKKASTAKTAPKKVAAKKATPKKKVAKVDVLPQKEGTLYPTTYTEVSRIHKGALASKQGTVVVTSSQNNEGASLVSHLMAQRNAENGHKTLLVDLNMRSQSLSNSLAAPRMQWNLVERVMHGDVDELIQPVKGVPNLYFMAAPLDTESALFLKDSVRAAAFFEILESQFAHVVVDTTPVSAMNRANADPMILASAVARTIFVMMAGVTPRKVVARTVKQLKEAGANLEGIVVNDQYNPSLRSQLLNMVHSISRIAPGLGDWLRYKVLHAEHLD